MSGFGVMDQSLSTVTGILVSQIMEEEVKIAWRWAMEVVYTCCPYIQSYLTTFLFSIKHVKASNLAHFITHLYLWLPVCTKAYLTINFLNNVHR